MATKWCPRCKEQRMVEWFGDPKQPYAICLSCRVEMNGEKKRDRQQKAVQQAHVRLSQNCAICCSALLAQNHDICSRCDSALKILNTPKLLGRAAAFVSGRLRISKHKPKKFKQRSHRLYNLIHAQQRDANDRELRFEHAVSK